MIAYPPKGRDAKLTVFGYSHDSGDVIVQRSNRLKRARPRARVQTLTMLATALAVVI